MGELKRSINDISKGYGIYLVVLTNKYHNSAERVINEIFDTMAYEIGEKNVIIKIMSETGIKEAVETFGIKNSDRWPILLIMEKPPQKLESSDKVIKINLGNYGDNTDLLKDDLFNLTRFVASDEFGKILWEQRKKRILLVLSKVPYVEILTMALGFTGKK